MQTSNLPQPDETPIRRAKRLAVSLKFRTFSPKTQEHLRRVNTKLPPELVKVLDEEAATYKTCRWVAYGKRLQDRAVRLALALLMRREADIRNPRRTLNGWAWAKEPVLAASEKLWVQTPQCKQLVRLKLLAAPGETPDTMTFAAGWARAWPILRDMVLSLDRTQFSKQVDQLVASRRRRPPPTKRKTVKLDADELAAVEALDTLKRIVLRGGKIRLDDLTSRTDLTNNPNLVQKASDK